MSFAPVVLAALLLVYPAMLYSAADQQPAAPHDALLNWHTVSGTPWWVDGIQPKEHLHPWAPQFHYNDHRHQILLRSGEVSRFRLAAGQILRLEAFRDDYKSDDLEIWESNGTGLSRRITALEVGLNNTRVVAPTWHYDRLITVRRPAHHRFGKWFIVLRSEYTQANGPLPDHRALLLLAERTLVATPQHGQQMYQSVIAGQPYALPTDGKFTELELLTRIEMPAGRPDPVTISINVDGKTIKTQQLLPRVEQRQVVHVDQCARGQYSQRERVRFTLPEVDGQYSLTISANALLRASAHGDDDYLLPSLNRRHRTRNGFQQQQQANRSTLLQHIDSISRDGVHHDAGLIALTNANEIALRQPQWREVARLAKRIHGSRSYYRALYPVQSSTNPDFAAQHRLYAARQLQSIDTDRQSLVVNRQRLPLLLSSLSQGVFHLIAGKQSQQFDLHSHTQGSWVRVAIDRATLHGKSALSVQFDEHPKQRLTVAPLQAPDKQRLDAHAGLASLQFLETSQRASGHSGTLGGAFAAHKEPADLVDVAWITLPIPPGARRLTVINEQRPLRLAIDERLARPLRAPQAAIIKRLIQRERVIDPALLALLRDHDDQAPINTTEQTFTDHYRHVVRFIVSRARLYQAQVRSLATHSAHHKQSDAALKERYSRAVKASDWPAAVDAAYRRLTQVGSATRHTSLSDVISALDRQGERFLADRLLRAIWLHDDDSQVTQTAWRLLQSRYQDDAFSQINLYATALVRDPQPSTLNKLAELLLDAGQFQLALDLGLAVTLDQAAIESLLLAAVSARRWQLFDGLLSHVNASEQRAFWHGYRAQLEGDYSRALKAWAQAGNQGARVAQRLQRALAIRQALDDSNADSEATSNQRAMKAWLAFSADALSQSNGGWRWQLAPELVQTHAGVAQQMWPELVRRRTVFRATAEQPVSIRVHGPTHLRLNMRLEHGRGRDNSVDDWLIVDVNGNPHRIAVNADRPVDDIQLTSQASVRATPGRLLTHTVNLGPGVHNITLKALQNSVLASVAHARPRLPLTALPPVNAATVAALTQPLSQRAHSNQPGKSIQWIAQCEVHDADRASGFKGLIQLPPFDATEITPHTITQSLPPLDRDPAIMLITDQLWQLEQARADPTTAMVAIEQLFADHHHRPGAQALIDRLRRRLRLGWQVLGHGVEGDGITDVPLPTWQPESPAARVREALLGESAAVRLVGAGQRLTVLLPDQGRYTYQFDLELAELGFLPARSLQIAWQLDNEAPNYLTLQQGRKSLSFDVPEGAHRLHVRSLQPVSNQFLRIYEHKSLDVQNLYQPQRRFHVASATQPVEVAINGPAWLRVDERVDGYTHSRYLAVADGWQNLTLEASQYPALQRVFVRTLDTSPAITPRRVTRSVQPVARHVAYSPLFNPGKLRYAVDDPTRPGMLDHGTWSLQGAWRHRNGATESGDDNLGIDNNERFIELLATHRKAQHDKNEYGRYQLLGRRHRDAGLVLGLRAGMRRPLPSWGQQRMPLLSKANWRLNGEVLHQNLTFNSDDNAWSLRGNLRVALRRRLTPRTSWTPGVEVFKRSFGMDSLSRRHRHLVDQDVFSAYQRDHDQGLALTNNWVFRPWFDHRLGARLRWVTNRNLNPFDPDYIQGDIDASQLFGDLQARVAYRERYYFNDKGRDRSRTDRRLSVDFEWRRWRYLDDRIALRASVSRDLSNNRTAWLVGVRYDISRGRGFTDFWPGEVLFQPLEERNNDNWQSASISAGLKTGLDQQTDHYEP